MLFNCCRRELAKCQLQSIGSDASISCNKRSEGRFRGLMSAFLHWQVQYRKNLLEPTGHYSSVSKYGRMFAEQKM
jgi:hypothetical protein